MSKIVAEVKLDGAPPKEGVGVEWVRMKLSLDGHSHVKLQLSSITDDDGTGARSKALDDCFKKLGKPAAVRIAVEGGDQEVVFNGFVSDAAHERLRNGNHALTLKIASPTVLLEGGPRCRVWEEKGPGDIAKSIVDGIKLLDADIGGLPGKKLPYEAQYNESDFAFLKRLAAREGFWLYFDGEKLRAVESFSGSSVPLSIGDSGDGARFEWFSLEARVRPGAFQQRSMLASNKKAVDHDQSEISSVDTSHDYVKQSRDASKELFPRRSHASALGEVVEEADQKQHAKALGQTWLRSLVVGNGVTHDPGLQPGVVVEVKGNGGPEDDKYVVDTASHEWNLQGGYSCRVKMLPVVSAYPSAASAPLVEGFRRARVVETHDDDHPNMVKVVYSRAVDSAGGDDGDAVSTWLRVATSHGGESAGFVAAPEIEDEVLVGHVGGRATHPVVVGSLFTPEKKSPIFDELKGDINDNNAKAWVTKSGNLMLMRDTGGKETIELRSPGGENVLRLTMDGGAQVLIETQGEVKISAKKNITFEAQGDMELKSKGKMKLSATGAMSVSSQQKLALAGLDVKVQGKKSAEVSAPQVKTAGTATAEISGAKVDVKGTAMVAVTGGLVKIN